MELEFDSLGTRSPWEPDPHPSIHRAAGSIPSRESHPAKLEHGVRARAGGSNRASDHKRRVSAPHKKSIRRSMLFNTPHLIRSRVRRFHTSEKGSARPRGPSDLGSRGRARSCLYAFDLASGVHLGPKRIISFPAKAPYGTPQTRPSSDRRSEGREV